MGSMVSISIGNYDFISEKNTFGDLLTIYSPEDRKVYKKSEDGETFNQYIFTTTAERAKKCLDCLGHTMDAAKISFEKSIQEKDYYVKLFELPSDELNDYSGEIDEDITFKDWVKAVKKYSLLLSKDEFSFDCKYKNLEKERNSSNLSTSERMVINSLPFEGGSYFGIGYEHIWKVFRVLLEAFQPEQEIILDYTDLYESGWCDEVPSDCDFCASKTIILTEGGYDADVISKSMNILYPYMSKFYSLLNFSETNLQGSSSFLTHYAKAFISAGIQNKIIVIYDNDAAGLNEIEKFEGIPLPSNFRIISLPHISLANNYPTIGPTNVETMNINGKACSIELFLGEDVLAEQGQLTPIMWGGYIEKIKTYQGEITNKATIQKRFEQKIKEAASKGIKDASVWSELEIVLNTIFNAFI